MAKSSSSSSSSSYTPAGKVIPPEQARTVMEFFPFYLTQHSNRTCRRLHFIGLTLAMMLLGYAIIAKAPLFVLYALLVGYGFAWIGHFGFEGNTPASFGHPFLSFGCDFVMWWRIVTGRVPF